VGDAGELGAHLLQGGIGVHRVIGHVFALPFGRSDVGQRSQVPPRGEAMRARMGTTPHVATRGHGADDTIGCRCANCRGPVGKEPAAPHAQPGRMCDERGGAMDLRTAGSVLLASASPTLTADLDAFRVARDELATAPRRLRTVAVVGLIPRAGRTTAAALLARCVAGYTDRRVTVVDAATPPAAPHPPVDGRPAQADAAGRTVTAMLGGDVTQGRLATLLDAPLAPGIARSRVRSALTPGALPSVLSLP